MTRARDIASATTPNANAALLATFPHKNFFINSDMQVAQRGTSIALAHDGNTSNYLIDRFRFGLGGNHEQLDGTYAQVDDHPLSPNGKSLKWTTGTAESSYDSDEYFYLAQIIEAQNLQRINNGNSNAVSLTLSFYVKSSVTGTFAVGIYKEDSTTRIFNKTYAISSANTWEKKTITFAGDTSGGGIVNDNGRGFYVNWHLAAGSGAVGGGSTSGWKNYAGLSDWSDGHVTNSIATTASATWQLAQCQLEIGEVATAFEHEDIGTTLAKCQRYYELWGCGVYIGSTTYGLVGVEYNDGSNWCEVDWQVEKRLATPVVGFINGFNWSATPTNSNVGKHGAQFYKAGAFLASVSSTNVGGSPILEVRAEL